MLNKGLFPVAVSFIIAIIIFNLSRFGLCLWHFDETKANILSIFFYGIRYDLSILSIIFAPLVLIIVAISKIEKLRIIFNTAVTIYCAFILALITFLEVATIPFMNEYGVRPNHIFLEYLIYPKEVFNMMLSGHKFDSIIGLLSFALAFFLFFKLFKKLTNSYKPSSLKSLAIQFLFVLIVLPLLARGSLTHKPLNPSNAAFCESQTANSIPVNSAFNLFYVSKHLGENSVNSSEIYAFATVNEVIDSVDNLSKADFITSDSNCPILQKITPSVEVKRKKNVVVILLESFGAQYVKSLGGLDLAPNIDSFSEKSWFFTNMMATGHRSVRGIEAVTASNLPSPLPSIVKLDNKDKLATLFSIFKKVGYKTSFIYGGESHFDNMRSYFFNNGVDLIIEQKDYKSPSFTASWGVSDEDLYNKANEYFSDLYKSNTSFCSMIFTSSFHDPFDIPSGKVDISNLKSNDVKRHMAVKYADYALGKFFKKAQKEPYYKDTIFVVIADHDSRAKNYSHFPLSNFHIPAFIIDSDIKPKKDNRLVSQIDILPTILSLSGVSGKLPIAGQDLTKDNIIQRAPIIYYYTYAYLAKEGGKNVITTLVPGLMPESFIVDDEQNFIKKTASNDLKNKVAFLNLPIEMHKHSLNKAKCIKDIAIK